MKLSSTLLHRIRRGEASIGNLISDGTEFRRGKCQEETMIELRLWEHQQW